MDSTTETVHSNENLPLWMRQARRPVDWGMAVALSLALLVGWPFLLPLDSGVGLPLTYEGDNSLFMAADTADALREGRLYPRWSAHALTGYGAPIPNYVPMGAAYVTGMVEVLLTDDTVTAVRLVIALSLLLAAGTTYAAVTRWTDGAHGLLASALYVVSPVVGMTTPYITGDLPLIVAHGLLPALLWAIGRLLIINRYQDLALSALLWAALLLTHPLTAAAGALLITLLSLWQAAAHKQPFVFLHGMSAVLLGAGVTAFFWGPALLERGLVTWIVPPWYPAAPALRLTDLFSTTQQIDPGALLPVQQWTLGLPLLVLLPLGLLALLRRPVRGRGFVWNLGGLGLAWLLLLLLIPLPPRTLAPIALSAAVMGSMALDTHALLPGALRTRLPARLSLPLLLIVALVGSTPVLLPPPTDRSPESTPFAQVRYEQQGYGVAVLPPGAPVPVTLAANTEANRQLTNSYQSAELDYVLRPDMLNPPRLTALSLGPHVRRYELSTSSGAQINYLTAYFPGWHAQLNTPSGPLPIRLQNNEDSGLMQITLPQSRSGELRISLDATPLRGSTWLFSWGMLTLLLLLTTRRAAQQPRGAFYDDLRLMNTGQTRLMATVMAAVIAVVTLITPQDPAIAGLRAGPNYRLLDAQIVRVQNLSGLELLGYRLASARLRTGQAIDLTLFWQVPRTVSDNYVVALQLEDVNRGTRSPLCDPRYPGGYPTRRWGSGYMTDRYTCVVPETMLPGTYRLHVAVLQCLDVCSQADRQAWFEGTRPGPLSFTLPQPLALSLP